MSKWISVKDELKPATKQISQDWPWLESKRYPVKVKGFKGWAIGVYIELPSQGCSEWRIDNLHGDFKVTYWFDIPEPPEDKDNERSE
jgi:hypothetical protein